MENPLVSVIVFTYNSAKTVLETLESIKAQTYQNIELIVSDDCSKDNTINVCREWINTHSGRFRRIEVVTVSENSGIPANLNRAERVCHGEWVKSIAGDDLLEPSCISDFVDYIREKPDSVYLFGRVLMFGNDVKKIEHFNNFFDYSFFNMSTNQQLERLIEKDNCIPASSFFYNLKKKNELGLLWDERIPLLEDLPMWINALKAGVRFQFIDKVVAHYRVGDGGLTSGSGNSLFAKSKRAYNILYVFNYKYKKDAEEGKDYLESLVNELESYYEHSLNYRIGKFILSPLRWIKRFIYRIRIKI